MNFQRWWLAKSLSKSRQQGCWFVIMHDVSVISCFSFKWLLSKTIRRPCQRGGANRSQQRRWHKNYPRKNYSNIPSERRIIQGIWMIKAIFTPERERFNTDRKRKELRRCRWPHISGADRIVSNMTGVSHRENDQKNTTIRVTLFEKAEWFW